MVFFSWLIFVEWQLKLSDVDVWTEQSKLIGELAISRVDDHGGLAPVAESTISGRVDIILI